jgi:hypothetical protein
MIDPYGQIRMASLYTEVLLEKYSCSNFKHLSNSESCARRASSNRHWWV